MKLFNQKAVESYQNNAACFVRAKDIHKLPVICQKAARNFRRKISLESYFKNRKYRYAF